MSHHRSDIPVVVLGSYVLGYLAGCTVAVLWNHGPADASGVRRLAGGAADVVGLHHPALQAPVIGEQWHDHQAA